MTESTTVSVLYVGREPTVQLEVLEKLEKMGIVWVNDTKATGLGYNPYLSYLIYNEHGSKKLTWTPDKKGVLDGMDYDLYLRSSSFLRDVEDDFGHLQYKKQ